MVVLKMVEECEKSEAALLWLVNEEKKAVWATTVVVADFWSISLSGKKTSLAMPMEKNAVAAYLAEIDKLQINLYKPFSIFFAECCQWLSIPFHWREEDGASIFIGFLAFPRLGGLTNCTKYLAIRERMRERRECEKISLPVFISIVFTLLVFTSDLSLLSHTIIRCTPKMAVRTTYHRSH